MDKIPEISVHLLRFFPLYKMTALRNDMYSGHFSGVAAVVSASFCRNRMNKTVRDQVIPFSKQNQYRQANLFETIEYRLVQHRIDTAVDHIAIMFAVLQFHQFHQLLRKCRGIIGHNIKTVLDRFCEGWSLHCLPYRRNKRYCGTGFFPIR